MTPKTLRVRGMGLELAVLDWGRGGDPTVVLLHGFQDVAASFELVAETLVEAGLRVIAPDLRGFGDSGRVPDGGYYHFPDYVFDVAELVDAVSPEQPILLVGHSMGGTIATLYAGTFPERVAKLALLEGVGPPAQSDDFTVERMRAWIDGVRKQRGRAERPFAREDAVKRLRVNHPNVPDAILRRRAGQLTRAVGEDLFVWNFDPLHRTRAPIAFSVDRWRAHASRITAETLFVSGGPTGFHPDDEAERIATIPNARTAEIAGAGHMLHWTKPAELAALLAEFLTGRSGSI